MTQVLFAAATAPLETDLDANFTELYTRTQLMTGTTAAIGIGLTPSAWSTSFKAIQLAGGAVYSNSANIFLSQNIYFDGTNTRYVGAGFGTLYQQGAAAGGHYWNISASGSAGAIATMTQAMTLDASGNLLVGQTSAGYSNSGSFSCQVGSGSGICAVNHATGTAAATTYIAFGYGGGGIGSISQTGTTGVAYNTSSDYRLKDVIGAVIGSGAFIDALKPCTWAWKVDGSPGVGFIAHELQAVSPSSVTGTKDAVDAEGKPVYQAVGYGSPEMVAMLVAELQSVRARLAALEAR